MSNSNTPLRTAPKITLSNKPEEDFNFYLQFVAPLVPRMPEEQERKLAAEWIKKLTEDKRDAVLRTEYLLLLLFALQRRHLSGPFLTSPSETEPLQPFENSLDMFEMMEMMAKEKRKPVPVLPYYSEVSGDFKEYVVAQEIPNFGVHCYLATSNEPIQKWKNPHFMHVPKETTVAEACQNGSSFEPSPVQLGSGQSIPSNTSQTSQFGEIIFPVSAPDSERWIEYSVNLQALRGVIPRVTFIDDLYNAPLPSRLSVPSNEAEHERVPSGSNVQGGSTQAENHARTSQEEEREFLSGLDNISNGELERLVAEFEEKLRPEMSEESSEAFLSVDATKSNSIRSRAPSQTGTRTQSRASVSQTERSRLSRNAPGQRSKYR